MIGLERVKRSVEELYEVAKANEELEAEMKPRQSMALNRLFLGNPGTGKTTVAQIYGSILRDFGMLSKGELVVKAASDFVGVFLGESQNKTKAILKEAEGCVLLIDEAYGLAEKSDIYKSSVIDTIVEAVQGVPGEDRCVVMLGYREQMESMLRESNPGLQRRFQMENAFQFDDYTDEELLRILQLRLEERALTASPDALQTAIEQLAILRATKPPFGNAGAVNNLLSEAIQRKAGRGKASDDELLPQDFSPPQTQEDEKALFDGLIGCESVVQVLREYQATFLRAQEKGQDPIRKLSLNFRFGGPPGTGKTTVAKRMGRMFKSLRVLPSSDVLETTGSDLIAPFVGQTAGKTREIMDKALGKVLFIDEAYSLTPRGNGAFGREAIDELVRCLTHEKYQGRMVVVLAGYDHDIEELMRANAGLKSRFETRIQFSAFSVSDACQLFHLRLKHPEVDLSLESHAQTAVQAEVRRLVEAPGFANGRDVESLVKRLERAVALKGERSKDHTGVSVSQDDLARAVDAMLADRKQTASSHRTHTITMSNALEQQQTEASHDRAPPPPETKIDVKASTIDHENARPPLESDPLACGSEVDPLLSAVREVGGSSLDDVSRLLAIGGGSELLAALTRKLGGEAAALQRIAEEDARQRAWDAYVAQQDEEKRARLAEEERARKELEAKIEQERLAAEQAALELQRQRDAAEQARLLAVQRQAEERMRQLQAEARAQQEAIARRRAEERRVQEVLQRAGRCPAGFDWYPEGGGYRCRGGSHFVSNINI